jgi:hypothetical protein
MQAAPPPAAAAPAAPLPLGRADYRCADGRRVLVIYRARDAVVRIERYAPLVLTREGPNAWRSDAYAGGPIVIVRDGAVARLETPGWPATTCSP